MPRRVAILPPNIDTIPGAFTFTDQTGVSTSTVITSAPITVTSVNAPAPITITAPGTYDINGSGSFTALAGVVTLGQAVRARLTSSAANNTPVSTTVTIGGISDTFTVTTIATPDTTPDPFTFIDQTNVTPSSVVVSAPITVTGIDALTSISVTGGEYDLNLSGSFTNALGSLTNGTTVRARHTASPSNSAATNTIVTIGGVSDTFTSTTVAGATSTIRFDPGHYGQLRTVAGVKTSEAVIQADLNVIAANGGEANIVGWAANFAWKQIETSQGVYDFTTPDRYFNACKAVGKRFIFRLDYRRYSGDGTQSVVPAYLYPSGQAATADGGATPRDWEAAVMDRIIACWQAIAAHYDSDPMFQAAQGMAETSISFDVDFPAPGNYTTANKKTQYMRWMDAMRGPSGFQFAQVWFGQNYLGDQSGSDCEEMIVYAKALRIGVGGPDSFQIDWVVPPNQSGKRPLWSDEVARGARGSGRDYRPGLAWPREAQGTELGGYIGNMLPQDILQSANYDGSQWMIWDYNTAGNNPGSTAATQWGNGSTQGILWVIRNFAVTNTSNPYAPTEPLPSQYPASNPLTLITWDAPTIVYPGIDVAYKMTGYDWFKRTLSWSLDVAPAWLSINSTTGVYSGSPPADGVNHTITVRLTPVGGAAVTKTFVMQVSASKCKFVSLSSGSDSSSGSFAAPYQTIGKALQVATAAGTGYRIYVRTGSYTQNFNPINVSLWNSPGTEANPVFCTPYPGEAPTLALGVDGPSFLGSRVIWDGIPISGGSGNEGGCITLDRLCVGKRFTTSGYRASGSVNPTGVKFYSGAILDGIESFNNLDSGGTTPQNWANFLAYCDNGPYESYVIDCIGNLSTCGAKIKHAGQGRIHFHSCVMYDVSNSLDMADNWSTTRHCLLLVNNSGGNNSAVGFGNSSDAGSDLGCLVDGCLIIAVAGFNGLSASPFYFYADAAQPARVRNCTFVCLGTASTAGTGSNWAIVEYPYATIPATQQLFLTGNTFYVPNVNKVQYFNLTELTLAQTNAKTGCSANVYAGALGTATLKYEAAGYRWSFTAAGGLVKGSAL